MSDNHITYLDGSNFKAEVIEANGVVLVDFWAAWCNPCKMLAPIIDELAVDYQNRLKFAKLNVDDNQQIAMEYGIMSIPSLVIFREGQEVNRIVGFLPKDELKRRIEALL